MKPHPSDILRLGISDRILMMHLYGIVNDIARLASIDTALWFAYRRGGSLVYLPMEAAGSVLGKEIGENVLQALIDRYGHTQKIEISHCVFLPRTFNRLAALSMLEKGHSVSSTAQVIGVPLRSLYDWKKRYLDSPNTSERAV